METPNVWLVASPVTVSPVITSDVIAFPLIVLFKEVWLETN